MPEPPVDGPATTVPVAFLAAAARRPDAPALLTEQHQLSHGQLAASSLVLARDLRAHGVGPEDRVGVLVRRDAPSVVGLLAVALAGAAYVPLDAASPDPRLTHAVTQGGVGLLLAPAGLHDRASSLARATGVTVVRGQDPCVGPVDRLLERPTSLPHPDDLAYVVFTSGSTGRPKGVEVSHRQLWAATSARFDFPDVGSDLLVLPLVFDAAAGGLYWALACGGSVVLPDEAAVRNPVRLRSLLDRFGVTHVNATPSLYDLVLDAVEDSPLTDLVYVDVGGEVLPPRLVQRHAAVHPDADLWNCYGPSETTVWATTSRCEPWRAATSTVPIGSAVRGYTAVVLGDDQRPVVEGERGELYVGGAGVARGYARDPRATAARFLPDPRGAAGSRRYRTGDRVSEHRDPGGHPRLVFHGRDDDMVKVRGHRVELGEVEVTSTEHPAVREVAVVQVRPGEGLDAVVVPDAPGLCAAELEDWLRTRLPSYLLPRVALVESLPRTSNGKLDRAAVVTMLSGRSAPDPVAPRESGGEPTVGVEALSEGQLDRLLQQLSPRRP